jgi:hypothetical protein
MGDMADAPGLRGRNAFAADKVALNRENMAVPYLVNFGRFAFKRLFALPLQRWQLKAAVSSFPDAR